MTDPRWENNAEANPQKQIVMNNSKSNFSNSIILDHEEVYDPTVQNVWPFKHVDDIVEGIKLNLGNMPPAIRLRLKR